MKIEQYINHFKTITLHKYFVLIECWKRGLYWQGIVHDLSKYSFYEFFTSARYFQGDSTPVAVEKKEVGYSRAWLHHKGINMHHWEYWTDFFEGIIKPCKIPEKYLIEIACDMIGASKAYLKHKYNQKEPLAYFNSHCDKWIITDVDKEYIKNILKKEANSSK